jgi:hypothetical protein
MGSQWTRILRRGLEEGWGKDTSIYIAPRLGSAEPLTITDALSTILRLLGEELEEAS